MHDEFVNNSMDENGYKLMLETLCKILNKKLDKEKEEEKTDKRTL